MAGRRKPAELPEKVANPEGGARYKTSVAKRESAMRYYYANRERISRDRRDRAAKLRDGKWMIGQSKLPEYEIWCSIKSRCYRPNNINYERYGARGVTMCPEWRASFLAFYKDVGSRPSRSYSLDRIDNDGNYEPGNVRWATKQQQGANTRKRRDNTSGYRGVYRNPHSLKRPWTAKVRYDGKDFTAGHYETAEEAAWMRDQWALALHGEFASLNSEYSEATT